VHKVVDICEHDLPLNYSKSPLIDSGDRAVAAPVSTTAARFDVSHKPEFSLGGPQAGVLLQGR
jgi:glycine cleavage system aminomethyltransferase T